MEIIFKNLTHDDIYYNILHSCNINKIKKMKIRKVFEVRFFSSGHIVTRYFNLNSGFLRKFFSAN